MYNCTLNTLLTLDIGMKITQEQFNAMVYYTLQAHHYSHKNENDLSYNSYVMAYERLLTMETCTPFLASTEAQKKAHTILCHERIGCSKPGQHPDWWNKVHLTPHGSQADLQKNLESNLNNHFKTTFTYTQNSVSPSFFMHFLDVYGKTLLAGMLLCLAGAAFLAFAPPLLAGMTLGAAGGMVAISLYSSANRFFSLPKEDVPAQFSNAPALK